MAYLHCHECGWSQDDFWRLFVYHNYNCQGEWRRKLALGYNPISKLISSIKWLWKPRWVYFDSWAFNDFMRYVGFIVRNKKTEKGVRVFSWSWLMVEIVKEWKIFREQKWWTYKSYLRDKEKGIATCPKCGNKALCID